MNFSTKQKQTQRFRNQIQGCQNEHAGARDKLGGWDWDTLYYTWNEWVTRTVQHRDIYSILYFVVV